MNITVIYPNKRKNKSTTYNIAQMLINKLSQNDNVYEFFLPEAMPHICCGCYACINGCEEKCVGYKYLKPITEAFEKSELIIFCSPVYVFHIPGQLKSLLDHFGYRWIIHRPDFNMQKKQAAIIVSAGGGGMKSTVKDIKDSMDYWGIARTHTITQAVWQYSWNDMPGRFKNQIDKKINKAAKKILHCKNNLRLSLKVKLLYMFYGILHKKGKMTAVDDKYWQENYNR